MRYDKEETKSLLFQSYLTLAILQSVEAIEVEIDSKRNELITLGFYEYIYDPDDDLKKRLADYQTWCKTLQGENSGHLMEEIAFLAFRCLKGWEVLESYRSFSAQHDLVITGSSDIWLKLMILLRLPLNGRTIVVEAKNLKSRVSDQQFSRLCNIVQNNFSNFCHLGVFFTRFGATGFPTTERRQALRDARATQLLFHAITNDKFVVVLDHNDLLQLSEPGSLPRILDRKIWEVEAATGLPTSYDGRYVRQPELPPHLAKYNRNSESQQPPADST